MKDSIPEKMADCRDGLRFWELELMLAEDDRYSAHCHYRIQQLVAQIIELQEEMQPYTGPTVL